MNWYAAAVTVLLGNVLLQVADVWTTTQALNSGAEEGNGVTLLLMESLGVGAWVLLKAFIIGVLLAVVLYATRADQSTRRQLAIPSMALFAWMTVVVINNVRILASI